MKLQYYQEQRIVVQNGKMNCLIYHQIKEVFQLDKSLITPISTKSLNQKALRPAKTGFDLSKTEQQLGLKLKSFSEYLIEFKKELD